MKRAIMFLTVCLVVGAVSPVRGLQYANDASDAGSLNGTYYYRGIQGSTWVYTPVVANGSIKLNSFLVDGPRPFSYYSDDGYPDYAEVGWQYSRVSNPELGEQTNTRQVFAEIHWPNTTPQVRTLFGETIPADSAHQFVLFYDPFYNIGWHGFYDSKPILWANNRAPYGVPIVNAERDYYLDDSNLSSGQWNGDFWALLGKGIDDNWINFHPLARGFDNDPMFGTSIIDNAHSKSVRQ
ncbi:MAG: hypothetical protein M1335_04985 [Chloroflexi bacterium]|nr:hypothetical protein [Chloroflexota bacterium]